MQFKTLAIGETDRLIFGRAIRPLQTRRGLTIGGGEVHPELNFTLPPMLVNEQTMPEVRKQYRQAIQDALRRAVELEAPGLIVEFETLPPMTENPAWAVELSRILLDAMEEAHAKHGLKSALRITPNDARDLARPARMRSGRFYETMMETFDKCAAAGAELLTWKKILPQLADMVQLFDAVIWIFGLIFMLAAALGVVNTLLMSTFERIHEFGVLKALGAGPLRIVRDVAAEAFLLALLSTLIGVAVGVVATVYLQHHGIDLSGLGGDITFGGVAFNPIWRATLTARIVWVPVVSMWLVCVLAALYPAAKAARLNVVRALTHV